MLRFLFSMVIVTVFILGCVLVGGGILWLFHPSYREDKPRSGRKPEKPS